MVDEKSMSQVLANDKRKHTHEMSNAINFNECMCGSAYVSLDNTMIIKRYELPSGDIFLRQLIIEWIPVITYFLML